MDAVLRTANRGACPAGHHLPVDAEVSREFAWLKTRVSSIEAAVCSSQEILLEAQAAARASEESAKTRLQVLHALQDQLNAITAHIGLAADSAPDASPEDGADSAAVLVDGAWG